MSIEDDVAALTEPIRLRVETASTVMLATRFSEMARAEAIDAERALIAAIARAERARLYLDRTVETLTQAIRLHAMGRE